VYPSNYFRSLCHKKSDFLLTEVVLDGSVCKMVLKALKTLPNSFLRVLVLIYINDDTLPRSHAPLTLIFHCIHIISENETELLFLLLELVSIIFDFSLNLFALIVVDVSLLNGFLN
jgi:hypothetical protein